MKLMFNKHTFDGHWFNDEEISNEWTEKVPQHTNQIFDEEQNEWGLKSEFNENLGLTE